MVSLYPYRHIEESSAKMPGFFFCKPGNGLEEAAMNQAPVGLENGADRAASSRENPVLFPAPEKRLGKSVGLLFLQTGKRT